MLNPNKVTLTTLFQKMDEGEPITWLTCYDYPTAYFQDQAGIDMILVGDSLGMTMLGYDSTLPVTMDDMVRHTQAVRRGAPNAFVIGDMPYMSYQPSVETAIINAGRLMSQGGADAIKRLARGELQEPMADVINDDRWGDLLQRMLSTSAPTRPGAPEVVSEIAAIQARY